MTRRKNRLYLNDIFDSIKKIEEYVKDLSFDDFSGVSVIVDAVVRNFEIIGEASKNLSAALKNEHPRVPWKEMAGMRDKMIHEYFGVDLGIIWKTIKQRLPELRTMLEEIKGA
jgi:uncharacterized protein with HEPN domain